ncbi:uncharacterized protein BXZ73DRAFT_82650 [Epithele typhae]|uniref:uncharacterized protein n=1 Tax=Epithele typhae TaxID=378194 RepID=UPI0020084F98|nr:uncharacterized protein BXZ73DRAFT_82650 [Epithele typhae]KAH9911730.1 hypothetical protein BXZ73DRAFT_82650 [Epithele typhae]
MVRGHSPACNDRSGNEDDDTRRQKISSNEADQKSPREKPRPNPSVFPRYRGTKPIPAALKALFGGLKDTDIDIEVCCTGDADVPRWAVVCKTCETKVRFTLPRATHSASLTAPRKPIAVTEKSIHNLSSHLNGQSHQKAVAAHRRGVASLRSRERDSGVSSASASARLMSTARPPARRNTRSPVAQSSSLQSAVVRDADDDTRRRGRTAPGNGGDDGDVPRARARRSSRSASPDVRTRRRAGEEPDAVARFCSAVGLSYEQEKVLRTLGVTSESWVRKLQTLKGDEKDMFIQMMIMAGFKPLHALNVFSEYSS